MSWPHLMRLSKLLECDSVVENSQGGITTVYDLETLVKRILACVYRVSESWRDAS